MAEEKALFTVKDSFLEKVGYCYKSISAVFYGSVLGVPEITHTLIKK